MMLNSIFFKAATVPEDQTDRGDAVHGRSSPTFHVPEQQMPRSPVEDSKLIKPLVMQFHLVNILSYQQVFSTVYSFQF